MALGVATMAVMVDLVEKELNPSNDEVVKT